MVKVIHLDSFTTYNANIKNNHHEKNGLDVNFKWATLIDQIFLLFCGVVMVLNTIYK